MLTKVNMKKVFVAACLFLVANINGTDNKETFLVVENNTDLMQSFGFIYNFGADYHSPEHDIEKIDLEPHSYILLRTDTLSGRNVFMRTNPSNRYEHAIIDIMPDTNGVIFLAGFDHTIQPHPAKNNYKEKYEAHNKRKYSTDESTSVEAS